LACLLGLKEDEKNNAMESTRKINNQIEDIEAQILLEEAKRTDKTNEKDIKMETYRREIESLTTILEEARNSTGMTVKNTWFALCRHS